MALIRNVVLEDEVAAQLDRAVLTHRRVEDAWAGLEWILARDPEAGVRRPSGHYVYKQSGFTGLKIPSFTVVYTFTQNAVTITALRVS